MVSTESPQREPAFWVGVSGHRRLDPAHVATIEARVRGVLEAIADAARRAAAPRAPRLVVVSPLAAGADQLVARVAMDLGFALQAPLPFSRENVRRDLEERGDDVEAFDRLLARAASVMERDGSLDERPEAYRDVGHVVLDHADLLVALWDGAASRGAGGTAEIVAAAGERGVPTMVVPPTGGEPRLLEPPSLEAVVGRIVSPLGVGAEGHDGAAHVPGQRRRALAFEAEQERIGSWSWRFGELAGRLWSSFAGMRPPSPESVDAKEEGSDGVGAGSALPRTLVEAHANARRLARHYADLYRSAFVANYTLGAFAVALALAGGLALVEGLLHEHHGATQPWGTMFAIAELASLFVMLVIWQVGRRGRWHERAVDYRTLAEQLRGVRLRWPLGLAPFRPAVEPHTDVEADLSVSWTQHVVREVARTAGLPGVSFTAEHRAAVARELDRVVEQQRTYHEDVARRYARLHHRLEGLALACTLGAVIACALHLVFHDPRLASWLIALAAGLPAVAAALHGIDGQAELERLSKRSAAMARWLRTHRARVSGETGTALARRTRTLLDRLLQETNDWQELSRAGDLKAT